MVENFIIMLAMLFFAIMLEDNAKIPSPITLILLSFVYCNTLDKNFLHINTESSIVESIVFLLPILILSDILTIKLKDLKENIFNLFYLAGVSIVLSVVLGIIILNTVFSHYEMSIPAIIILFSMLLATDPVSVISVFKQFVLPHKLKILAEGESLFNDAVALIIFSAIGLFMLKGNQITFYYVSIVSIEIVLFSSFVGLTIGLLSFFIYKNDYIQKNQTLELLLIIFIAYFSFYIAESIKVIGENHLSGILAEIVSILTIKKIMEDNEKRNELNLSHDEFEIEKLVETNKKNKKFKFKTLLKMLKFNVETNEKHENTKNTISMLAIFANAILFLTMAKIIDTNLLIKYWYEILMIFLVTTLIRSVMMLKFSLITKYSTKTIINFRWWSVLVLAGIKGGISIVMLHMIPDSFVYKEMFKAIVIGVILLSTFIYTFGLIILIGLNKNKFEEEAMEEIVDYRIY